jgi:hypothetical protein
MGTSLHMRLSIGRGQGYVAYQGHLLEGFLNIALYMYIVSWRVLNQGSQKHPGCAIVRNIRTNFS